MNSLCSFDSICDHGRAGVIAYPSLLPASEKRQGRLGKKLMISRTIRKTFLLMNCWAVVASVISMVFVISYV